MISIKINSISFYFKSSVSILEACEIVGIDIPRFCYHQSLSVAGNCRMCLMELSNSPKPVASCALPIVNNMKIYTDSPLVKKARENVLEALLLNHPLDCPICDQGGECDLQDQAYIFGINSSRFNFNKRSVEDKYCGPIIKTIMNRCIHCTRCVRFNTEISGNEFFGTLLRGGLTEIGPYVHSIYKSEMSGNIIDLCPVGALTSNPYSFKSRPWEIRTYQTIDLTDGLGSNIYVCVKETEINRIFPKINNEINETFISDKARFLYDSNKINRLNSRSAVTAKSSLNAFFSNNKTSLKSKGLFLVNNHNDLDVVFLSKNLEQKTILDRATQKKVFFNVKNINNNLNKNTNFFFSWLNNSVFDLNHTHQVCFLISSNIKLENAIINTKLRTKQNQGDFSVFGFGLSFIENFNIEFINLNLSKMFNIFESKNKKFSNFLLKQKNPLLIFGENLFKRGINPNFFKTYIQNYLPNVYLLKIDISSNLTGLNFFNYQSINSRVLNNTKILYTLNLDDSCLLKKYFNYFFKNKTLTNSNVYIFFFSTHISEIVSSLYSENKNLIPCMTEFEEERAYLSFEQRIQKTQKSLNPINKNVISIKNFLLETIKTYNNENNIYTRHFRFFLEMLQKKELFHSLKFSKKKKLFLPFNFYNNNIFNISKYPIKTNIEDYYLTNKMLVNSKLIHNISRFNRTKQNF